ncbi:MAG: hypothetical protein FWG24_06175 [Eggerthellaceae bacterium]|nr:hypothetical protein [Eggerthellaceae bacterium]
MARMNAYTNKMDQVETPTYLKDKVLAEVREVTQEAAPSPRRVRVVWGSLGAAAAVLALFALTFTSGILSPSADSQDSEQGSMRGTPFALVAYAAESGFEFVSSDGLVAFGLLQGGSAGVETGMFTGCMFGIEGDDIVRVELELDRGQIGIYTEEEYVSSEDSFDDKAREAALEAITSRLKGSYDPESISEYSQDKLTFTVGATRLMSSACDILAAPEDGGINLAEVKFEFWLAPEDLASEEVWQQDLRKAWQQSLDALDGQTIKVTVHYADGSYAKQAFILKTGKMKVRFEEGVGSTVLPEPARGDDPYVYAVYGIEVAA